ncbi:MAG: aminopeptidase [Eggerthellales bacterium]|nr:aminopeptidase [Eggerthellales bacterium]
MERKNAWKTYTDEEIAELNDLCDDYIEFISTCKTERLCCSRAEAMARAEGYRTVQEIRSAGETLKPGDKVYAVNYGKGIIMAQLGTDSLESGVNILGAHIDSPRIDIKQNPVYEADDFALLDTHYYGGIKQYQWVTMPLALYGVVAKTDGTVVNVAVGDDPADPVFCITDLLPHLDNDQMKKGTANFIEVEDLDILVGGRPLVIDDKDESEDAKAAAKEPVKALLLSVLKERFDMEEEDFLSAELEIVPAGPARDLGFDRSMVIGYGQDDRVCAYTSLVAQLEVEEPKRTALTILVDKEEIGSVGATGMTSRFFENFMAEVLDLAGETGDLALRRCLANSSMLSSDVSAAFDPLYAAAFEKKNAAFCGRGIVFNKFTGARGKSGSNDSNAEYVAAVRRVMEEGGVAYQTAELGRVGLGGGGTIAYILAEYGMNVIDSGVAVLSMHAPWEVTSKADIYEAYKGYKAFLDLMD